jgi:5-methylcytosine-specific restriction endonuclease McrA
VQDEDYIESTGSLWKWLDAREVYLKRREEQNGGNLVCDYCGRERLEIGGKKPEDLNKNNKNPNLATIDHIHPLADEGEQYNENNMCVSCKTCNRKKSKRSLEDYLISLPQETLEKTAKFLIERAANKEALEFRLLDDWEKLKRTAIKSPILSEKIKNLTTQRLLAFYKAERKRYYHLVGSYTCECCGEPVWHIYSKEDSSKQAYKEVKEKEAFLNTIKEELKKREHIK